MSSRTFTTRRSEAYAGNVAARKRRSLSKAEKERIAVRARTLREHRGLTQEAAASASRGALTRVEVAKIETAKNLATTERVLSGLATAYNVPPMSLGAYLHGEMELQDLLSSPTDQPGYVKLGNIEATLSYHGHAWSSQAIAAAKAHALVLRNEDPTPAEWKKILDRIDKALREVGVREPDRK